MRIIDYILPVDAMHGSLCERRKHVYGDERVPGWSASNGIVSANGYIPNIIAAQKKRSRVRYFMVRCKSSINWTNGKRMDVAAFAGAGAIYQAVRRDVTLLALVENVRLLQAPRETLRQFLFPKLTAMLKAKQVSITLSAGSYTAAIDNPWRAAGTPNITISSVIINKYNTYLS